MRLAVLLPLVFVLARLPAGHAADEVDFNRDIRPLLSNRCVACHGPDQDQRKAKLRLDTEEGARADLGGWAAVVPGKPGESELIRRISSDDDDEVMPPPEKGQRFSPAEVELFTRWIGQGGKYQTHWAYQKPVRAVLPPVAEDWRPANEIDHFLFSRLAEEGLRPGPEADRRTLARRWALDLTGLPPAWDEVEAFVRDPRPDEDAAAAYVDKVLARPSFGEHWATPWLDLARYADSSGYPSDQPREIWGYRDWVIGAINRNLPFDQFTLEQIAGDLLPEPSDEQRIATAFHRNTMTQNEGGTSDEEFRTAAVVDRVNTTLAVWMGTTMACAQCHTHKFDPITQEEYFRVFAIFNQSADADRKDETPVHAFHTPAQQERRASIQAEMDRLDRLFREPDPAVLKGMSGWENGLPVRGPGFEPPEEAAALEAIRILSPSPDAARIRLHFVPDGSEPVPARRLRIESISDKYHFLGLTEVEVFSGFENLALNGTARQISTNPNGPKPEEAIDGKLGTASVTGGGEEPQWWEVTLPGTRPVDRIVLGRGPKTNVAGLRFTLFDDAGAVVWESTLDRNPGEREELTVSGRTEIALSTRFPDAAGKAFTLIASARFEPPSPGRWVVNVPEPVLLASGNTAWQALRAVPAEVLTALTVEPGRRSGPDSTLLSDWYARRVAPELKHERVQLAALGKELDALKPATVPVMAELPEAQRRVTKVQIRGNWQNLGTEVTPGVPAAFHPLPADREVDRLALAQWLVSPDNPLTARVVVNRFWEAVFGVGLVRTSEEFGSQGEPPSHPELLDWLAVDFMEHGWDVKRLLRLVVLSRAYRQDSAIPPGLADRDPENRLVARGPRFRPPGELLRDQALEVAGLLSGKMGGPSVRPPAPNIGLSTAFGRSNDWTTSPGEDRWRRSVYTEVRRNAPYASFATFDAPNREVCTIRRNRTNTPLQAFVTLNDPVFVEASQGLARRLLRDSREPDPAAKIRLAYRWTVSREPDEAEIMTLRRLFDDALTGFRSDTQSASRMATDPLGPAPDGLDVTELAAWTVVSNVILNLDEFLMRR